jgi:hypothetical protein
MTRLFDHERLRVYEASIEFVAWLEDAVSSLTQSVSARDHVARASASVPVNIAAATLDVLAARQTENEQIAMEGKSLLADSVRMLVAWQQSIETT